MPLVAKNNRYRIHQVYFNESSVVLQWWLAANDKEKWQLRSRHNEPIVFSYQSGHMLLAPDCEI